jgi:hypothetical protein
MELLNKFLYRIPLATQRYEDEVSGVIQEDGAVIRKVSKDQGEEFDPFWLAMGIPISEGDSKIRQVTFKTKSGIEIKVDDPAIFDQVNEGDNLQLRYKMRSTAEYDFSPPNFTEKVLTKRLHQSYELVSLG